MPIISPISLSPIRHAITFHFLFDEKPVIVRRMIATYKARLKGNLLDWQEEIPPAQTEPISVLVTLLPETSPEPSISSGRRIVGILSRLAAISSLATIPDPVAWQKEQRRDRPFPDREE